MLIASNKLLVFIQLSFNILILKPWQQSQSFWEGKKPKSVSPKCVSGDVVKGECVNCVKAHKWWTLAAAYRGAALRWRLHLISKEAGTLCSCSRYADLHAKMIGSYLILLHLFKTRLFPLSTFLSFLPLLYFLYPFSPQEFRLFLCFLLTHVTIIFKQRKSLKENV